MSVSQVRAANSRSGLFLLAIMGLCCHVFGIADAAEPLRAEFDRADKLVKQYDACVLVDEVQFLTPAQVGQLTDVADTLRVKIDRLGPVRAKLIKKGMIYSPAHGDLAFTVPLFDEFMLQYQLPIMAEYGLVAYGCCEDLTRKIDVLRQIRNLRRIAVTPVADVRRCAEQIGTDYVISWRPNPTDMVCAGWDDGAGD